MERGLGKVRTLARHCQRPPAAGTGAWAPGQAAAWDDNVHGSPSAPQGGPGDAPGKLTLAEPGGVSRPLQAPAGSCCPPFFQTSEQTPFLQKSPESLGTQENGGQGTAHLTHARLRKHPAGGHGRGFHVHTEPARVRPSAWGVGWPQASGDRSGIFPGPSGPCRPSPGSFSRTSLTGPQRLPHPGCSSAPPTSRPSKVRGEREAHG